MPQSGEPDRSLTLLHLRKTFSAYLKKNHSQDEQLAAFDQMLPLFNRVTSMFTPDDLAVQFKELVLFTQHLCEIIVLEIRQRANVENTGVAALAVHTFLRPPIQVDGEILPSSNRGWMILNAISFILHSGMPKVLEIMCKTTLPSTLIKLFYIFFDLPPPASKLLTDPEDSHQKLYDILVSITISLCENVIVTESLIQRDDLVWLFVGASAPCENDSKCVTSFSTSKWREANFCVLLSVIGKSLSPSVTKYIHSKGCIGHYLKNIRAMVAAVPTEKSKVVEASSLLCNALELMRRSAVKTQDLLEDFRAADGYRIVVEFCGQHCVDATGKEARYKVIGALAELCVAGDSTVHANPPTTSLSFYNFKLKQSWANSEATVRVMDAFVAMERSFRESKSEFICLGIVEQLSRLFSAERINYFIVERHAPLTLFVESMKEKSPEVQDAILNLVEFILRELHFIPSRELATVNALARHHVNCEKLEGIKTLWRYLSFFFRILPINICMKDAFRELLVLETFFNIVIINCSEVLVSANHESAAAKTTSNRSDIISVTQMAMDLLVATTKGNALNAQFVAENMDGRVLKLFLIGGDNEIDALEEDRKRVDEFRSAALILIKNLLCAARNEQLLSHLLQLLFAEPSNLELCGVVLKIFVSTLLESHKVRVMFRRSGGFICLMTLLLHLENFLAPSAIAAEGHQSKRRRLRNCQEILQIRRHVTLIFRVLIVAMRYEPSNAKYFLVEVKPPMLVSILRGMGCFVSNTSSINEPSGVVADVAEPSLAEGDSVNSSLSFSSILGAESTMWTTYMEAEDEQRRKCLAACHTVFQSATTVDDYTEKDTAHGLLGDVLTPPKMFSDVFLLLRLLVDLALDNYEKPSNTITFARVEEWLAGSESVESIPVLYFSTRTVLVHPSAVICLLQLLPFVASFDPSDIVPSESSSLHHHLWSASAQFYIALVLKALLRSERNQQTMCQHSMPKELLATGAAVFRAERHPLLAPFYYLFERLACHAMHPGELRRFLRLDQPLCCLNLDDDDNNHEMKMIKSGGPVPLHRVKALVSMLTPRSHALIHPPAFVEFDMAIEGFACLFAPSIANVLPMAGGNIGGSSESGTSEKLFPPMNGFTYMIWFYVDECGYVTSVQSSPNDSTCNSPAGSGAAGSGAHNSTISLLNIVRQYESGGGGVGSSLDTYLSCFSVQLNVVERNLLVSSAEHAVADELRRNFSRPPETFVRLALPDTVFHARQWIHLAVIMQRSLLRPSHVDVYMNGKQLGGAPSRIAYVTANAGASVSGGAASSVDYSGISQTVHAFIGTPPLLRRAGDVLRWRMASAYLIDEPLGADAIRRAMQLQPHYIGNLQTPVNGGGIISTEDCLILALNAAANAELTSQVMRSITRLSDCEMVGSLLGISTNDSSTPLRILWNMATVAIAGTSCTADSSSISADSRRAGAALSAPVGAILIGYLGMRTFAPCPVSALLDSIGGVAPLLGLIAMCSDSDGLYASLKALASAAHTNAAIGVALTRQRGYQTLAMLLEEKAHFLNAHSLHLVLALTGTALSAAEASAKESASITNLQTFNDLLCDLDVWARVQQDVKRLLFDHLYELVIDDQHSDNLTKVRASSLLDRILVLLFESDEDLFGVRHDVLFRLVGAIVQPPCEAALLLRLGQTIAATMAPDGARGMETEFPFHIAELERCLLTGGESACVKWSAEDEDEKRKRMYSVYVRNRLLNSLSTMIAHSSEPMNSKICTTLIDALGFGWLLALCAPRIHAGTLHLTLRILVQIVTKYPTMMERFREGIGAGGWLSDADSVVRNRAAVLLGFSVAARTGAVGSAVDVNPPELTACSGFAALEHISYAHAQHPFVHLAVLALLFRQPTVNLQPLDTFSIDAVWSHVFVLPQNSSVATAIENVQFCAEALIPLLALIRACLHRQLVESQENHWSHKYPLMLGQLLTFLYQNSSAFFSICHTETFVVTLFSTLLAAPAASEINNSDGQKSETNNAQMPCVVESRAARLLKEMLTNVLLNDLCLSHEQRVEWPFDALVEFLESGAAVTVNSFSASFSQVNKGKGSNDARGNSNGISSTVSATALYTDIVNACLERFMTSEMFGPTSAGPPLQHNTNVVTNAASESTALNVVHFLGKVIDSVWNCLYRSTTINILKCFLKLLADAHATHKAAAQLACTDAHLNALFRIMLYLLSRPIDNVDTQMSVLDTLAEIVRNQHLLLARRANNPLHYGALVHLVFMLSERPDMSNTSSTTNCSVDKSHLERGTAQVAMCAQNVWGMLWQHKKALLDELFKRDVDLDLYTARAACGDAANDYWLQFVDAQTDCSGVNNISAANSSSAFSRMNATNTGNGSGGASNAVGNLLQSRLSRVARTGFQRLTNRHSLPLSGGGGSIGGIGSGGSSFQFERPKIDADTFHMWMRVHVSLVRELVRARCQRQHEWHAHVRKWSMKEWQENVEAELIRERGLWGPERGSRLDKFELDTTEGPLRVRKKLVPDVDFYRRYPFRPYLDLPEAKSLRAKLAVSKDSREYYQRMCQRRFNTMDERILDNVMPQSSVSAALSASVESSKEYDPSLSGSFDLASSELNLSLIKRMMRKNIEIAESAKKQERHTTLSEEGPDGEEGASGTPKNDNSQEVLEENEEEDVLELIEGKSADDSTSPEGIKLKSVDAVNLLANERLTDTSKVRRSLETLSVDVSGTTSVSPTTTTNTVAQKRASTVSQQSPSTVGGTSGPDNQTLLRLLEHGEQLHSMFRCARVQGLDTFEGLLLFGRSYFYVVDGFTLLKTREIRDLDFLPEQFHDPIVPYMAMGSAGRPATLKSARRCSKFAYDSIREVHKRRFLLQPIALEVFSADGRNYLLAFPRRIRDRVFQKFVSTTKSVTGVNVGVSGDTTLMAATTAVIGGISSATHRNRLLQPAVAAVNAAADGRQLLNQLIGSGGGQLSGVGSALINAGGAQPSASVTQRWQRGEMSNFHYLMYLNTLAGRSYNDLSQYPVFPWILADYESERLDLTSPHTFRDLSRPMGAQTPDRLAKFLRRFCEWDDPSGDTPPYMYGTHYSSAMIVLSYLVRLEPFTQQFLKLQGGHFDLADRMFHSVRDAWASASRNNMADVRELIPEFFYLPEMFLNSNCFDLGAKQNGVVLHHVELPRWANGDSHEFVRLHRQALESDYVSEHLHEWIDLIFGVKQSGDAARDSFNVFHHLFYERNVNVDTIDDPLTRNATLAFINNFGQIPSQLFRRPHLQRRVTAAVAKASTTLMTPGVTTPKLFYHCVENLRVSAKPVKELRAAVGDIVINERNQVIVLEQNRIFVPPSSYMAWGFADRSVRVGAIGTEKSDSVLETSDVYEITCMATADGGRTVFAGLTTGSVLVWTLVASAIANLSTSSSSGGASATPTANSLTNGLLHRKRRALDAHTDVVTALAASAAHSCMVSASRDRSAVVWHLTRFTFLRQLGGAAVHPSAVTAVAINEATGDIATASGSLLYLWTINGVLLSAVDTSVHDLVSPSKLCSGCPSTASLILCICFSTLYEWDVNNVLVCGTSDGFVKIYSSQFVGETTTGEQRDHRLTSLNDVDSNTNFRSRLSKSPRPGGSGCPDNVSGDGGATKQQVREHILRRQQRIQSHHKHRLAMMNIASSGGGQRSSSSSSSFSSSTVVGPPLSPSGSGVKPLVKTEQSLSDKRDQQITTRKEESEQTYSVENAKCFRHEQDAPTHDGSITAESSKEQQCDGHLHSRKIKEAAEELCAEDLLALEVMPPTQGALPRHRLLLRRVLAEHTAFRHAPHPAPVTSLRPTRDHKSLLVGDGVGRVWLWTTLNNND